MNTKILWVIGYLFCAGLSCWATASSFHLLFPSWPIVIVYGLTIAIFVLSSLAFDWMCKSFTDSHILSYPRARLFGWAALWLISWVIVSLPTNSHTFFYMFKIDDVVTKDLYVTKTYLNQLKNREVVDTAGYNAIEKPVLKEWENFTNEVKHGNTGSGFGEVASSYVAKINTLLPPEYSIPIPRNTNRATDAENTKLINEWFDNYIKPSLKTLKEEKFQVSEEIKNQAEEYYDYIGAFEDSIEALNQTAQISEPHVQQARGLLKKAYPIIGQNSKYVIFNNIDDEKLYTAENVETRTNRFLNPYYVVGDFFAGKLPFYFLLLILLSILVDVAAFIFFAKAF